MAILYYLTLLLSVPAAIYFLVLFARCKQGKCLAAALLWLVPPCYEIVVLGYCTGECNIRVDLLVVFPLEVLVLIPVSRMAYRAHAQR